jgi:DNA-binding CsgD family transcriptional regulator
MNKNLFKGWSDASFAPWLAGFMDGEGHIAPPSKDGASITLTNTRRDLIYSIQARLNLGHIERVKFLNQPKWKDKYNLRFTRYLEAKKLLDYILPYLTIKRDAANKVLIKIAAYLSYHQGKRTRNAEIVALRKKGLTHQEIATRYGIKRTSVTQILRWVAVYGNVPMRRNPDLWRKCNTRKPLSVRKRKEFHTYYESGVKRTVISKTKTKRFVSSGQSHGKQLDDSCQLT